MAEIDEESLIGALEEALGARLVVEEEGSVYAFTHALVRETLYGALSAPRRQRMHARAALAIEAVEGSDHDARIAALALHYRLAGPAVDPAKGIAYSLRAGERARQLFAWDETAAHWAGALALMERAGTEPAERARLLEALAVVCAVLGDLARQIGYLERALGLYVELGDDERAAQVHSRLGMAHSLIDSIYAEHLDIRRAFRHFDAARSVLERGPVRTARGHLETGVATALTYGLRIEPGIEAASRAIAIAEQLGDEALWAGAVEAYGWHKIVAGELTEGLRGAGARLRGCRSGTTAVPGLDGVPHSRPDDLGTGRSRSRAGLLRAAARTLVRRRDRVRPATRRRHRPLSHVAGGAGAHPGPAVRRQADLDHPLAPAAGRPVGGKLGSGRGARAPSARDQSPDGEPVG